MKRTANCPDEEPKQSLYELPSEKEHSFSVVDVQFDETDTDIVYAHLEVASGDEIGRKLRNRLNLNDQSNMFWATRLFLKAIKEPHKGIIDIDTDNWFGRSFVASVKHGKNKDKTKTFANIDKYNFDADPQIEVKSNEPKEVSPAAWTE